MVSHHWDRCIDHYDEEVSAFFIQHFSENTRNCLFIAGAGFDPRSTLVPNELVNILKNRLSCLFIKEERPDPDKMLIEKADKNLKYLQNICVNNKVLNIDVFSDDSAVIGGINIISSLRKIELSKYTDIIMDFSALSIGISFPIVKYFYDNIKEIRPIINIHMVVVANPELDSSISSSPNDRATEVRGFPRRDRLMGEVEKAKLWLPQLSGEKQETLRLIFNDIVPHDTCPILPFPSDQPKKGDELATSFLSDIVGEWNVDTRNFVYADESNPLDLYRTILKIDDERRPVFDTFGGSVVILSPLGSKMLAIGALMAALERNFPVVYVEALKYNVNWERAEEVGEISSRKAHIWLYGEAYLRDTKA